MKISLAHVLPANQGKRKTVLKRAGGERGGPNWGTRDEKIRSHVAKQVRTFFCGPKIEKKGEIMEKIPNPHKKSGKERGIPKKTSNKGECNLKVAADLSPQKKKKKPKSQKKVRKKFPSKSGNFLYIIEINYQNQQPADVLRRGSS